MFPTREVDKSDKGVGSLIPRYEVPHQPFIC